MSDYMTFPTKKKAQEEIKSMRGWNAVPIQLHLPFDLNCDKNGNVWAIQCNGDKYLRKDGFVR